MENSNMGEKSPEIVALENQLFELAKSYQAFIANWAQTSIAEFNPHPKAIATLMSKITAYNNGKKIVFTDAEIAIIEKAVIAAQNFLNVSNLFPESVKAAIRNMLNNAISIVEITKKLRAEQQEKQKAIIDKTQADKKQRIDKAKTTIDALQATHDAKMLAYKMDLEKYPKDLIRYNMLSDNEKMLQKAPIFPQNPDETLLDGVTLTQIYADLERQMSDINSIQINTGHWFCGPAATTNVVMNYNPEGYVKAVIELATKGETRFRDDSPIIKLPEYLEDANAEEISQFGAEKIAVDIIFGHSLRETENGKFKKSYPVGHKKREGTFPWEIESLLEDCGIEVDEKSYYTAQNKKDLKKIEAVVTKGHLVIVFENKGITTIAPATGLYGIIGKHYITLHEFTIKGDKVEFRYWEYGYKSELITRTIDVFLKGMKGYWIPEAPISLEEEENKNDKK